MKLEKEIRYSLQKKAQRWELPTSVRHEIMQRIDKDRQKNKRTRTKLIPICIAVALILPTGAFAGCHYLADSIYGSGSTSKDLKNNHLQEYERLEAKLQASKAQLPEAEYNNLSKLLGEIAAIYTPYMEENGEIDTAAMSGEELNRLKQLEQEIQKASAGIDTTGTSDSQQMMDYKTFLKISLEDGKKSFSPEKYTSFSLLVEETLIVSERYEKDQATSPAQDSKDFVRLAELETQLHPYFEELGYTVK